MVTTEDENPNERTRQAGIDHPTNNDTDWSDETHVDYEFLQEFIVISEHHGEETIEMGYEADDEREVDLKDVISQVELSHVKLPHYVIRNLTIGLQNNDNTKNEDVHNDSSSDETNGMANSKNHISQTSHSSKVENPNIDVTDKRSNRDHRKNVERNAKLGEDGDDNSENHDGINNSDVNISDKRSDRSNRQNVENDANVSEKENNNKHHAEKKGSGRDDANQIAKNSLKIMNCNVNDNNAKNLNEKEDENKEKERKSAEGGQIDDGAESYDEECPKSVEVTIEPIQYGLSLKKQKNGIMKVISVDSVTMTPKSNRETNKKLTEKCSIEAGDIFVIPGKQKKSQVYICGHWSYTRDWRIKSTLRCSKRDKNGCKAKIRLEENGSGKMRKNHIGHDPEPYLLESVAMTKWIEERAVTTADHPTVIYDLAQCRYPNSVKLYLSKKKCATLISRRREKIEPTLPESIQQLSSKLKDYIFTKDILCGEICGKSTALIFMTKFMANALGNGTSQIMINISQVTEYVPGMNHLLTIDLIHEKRTFLALVAICEERSEYLYKWVMKALQGWLESLTSNLNVIISPPEKALINVLKSLFPDVKIKTCPLYFYEATSNYWLYCGLNEAPKDGIWKCWALPSVPTELWDAALNLILKDLDEISMHFENAQKFGIYLRQQWKPLAAVISSKKPPLQIMTLVESSANFIKTTLNNVNGNFWQFAEKMYYTMDSIESALTTYQGAKKQSWPSGYSAMRSEGTRKVQVLNRHKPLTMLNLADFMADIVDETRKELLDIIYLSNSSAQLSGLITDCAGPHNFHVEEECSETEVGGKEYYGPVLDEEESYMIGRLSKKGSRKRRIKNSKGQQLVVQDSD